MDCKDVNFLILPKLIKRLKNSNWNPIWGVGVPTKLIFLNIYLFEEERQREAGGGGSGATEGKRNPSSQVEFSSYKQMQRAKNSQDNLDEEEKRRSRNTYAPEIKAFNKAEVIKDISVIHTRIKRSNKENREFRMNPNSWFMTKVILQSKERQILISLTDAGTTDYLHGKRE